MSSMVATPRPPRPAASSLARALALAAAFLTAPFAALPAQAPATTVAKATPPAQPVAVDSTYRDSTEVADVARRYAGTVKNCYEQEGLKLDPTLRGLLQLDLTVLPTGAVQAATATAINVTGAGMPAVATCVAAAAREWRFSEGAAGTERLLLDFDLLPPAP